ncbi:cardiolipin synthase [Sphingomonas sp. SM33]|uniref:Cardiolipin synthase n=1 Tax=Sphingomonas telluris TaxID=2907998 RepID=A0ABS9VJS3_9SPHN|nr:cardiolipin synthase [Sphingomonas telluris]MCH8615238.1 cardiolipin synthase [Sphingomonas telluris]
MQPLQMILAGLLTLAEIAVLIRAILRPHREPASRLAWAVVIIVAPVVGLVAYLLLGEVRISLGRREKGRAIEAALHRPPGGDPRAREIDAGFYRAPFALSESINGLAPTSANEATLAADSNVAIREMVQDIDAAKETVHLLAYIWLDDCNGCLVRDALIRAAERGVKVRALADALGSRKFIRSKNWRELVASGGDFRVALPVGNPFWTFIRGRVDLRNHRKMLIIDNMIAWCGSQNVADPEFRIKPHYAPWVDVMSRWRGPVARHCQYLFVSDWMGDGGDDISGLLSAPTTAPVGGKITAQVIGTGPTVRYDAMPSCFSEFIHSAREELVVTTPYFVPDEQVLFALLAAARRGVRTVLVLPQRNDSRVVQATSRSYYEDLVHAGVNLLEYRCGLLHAKTMVADRKIGLIGSANLDRRSFELNFENNILFADEDFAAAIRARQDEYIADSDPVTQVDIDRFSIAARLWQNSVAMLSPIL